jgi:hypothetical protein
MLKRIAHNSVFADNYEAGQKGGISKPEIRESIDLKKQRWQKNFR